MINLLQSGQWQVFAMVLFAIVFALSFHEFGHAWVAKLYGDDTAERLGRLTLNPLKHIDPFGLLAVVLVGFGWARPVPFNPRNFTSRWGTLMVAAAGPLANLILAFLALNLPSLLGLNLAPSGQMAIGVFALINTVLVFFNLIPLGPLDGHHILPYFLPTPMAARYRDFNARYGTHAILGLMLASIVGINVFGWLIKAAYQVMSFLTIV